MVGATRESVSPALNQMAKAGLVELGRRRIRLLDLDGVQLLFGPSSSG